MLTDEDIIHHRDCVECGTRLAQECKGHEPRFILTDRGVAVRHLAKAEEYANEAIDFGHHSHGESIAHALAGIGRLLLDIANTLHESADHGIVVKTGKV